MGLLAIIPFLSSAPSSGVLAQSPYGTQYSCFFVDFLRMMLFCIISISQLTISCLNVHMRVWSAYRVCGFIELYFDLSGFFAFRAEVLGFANCYQFGVQGLWF